MRVKRLLAGSTAGLVAVATAQAADLPAKARPVQFVKTCALYGDGFYSIPGTDTCIRFSSYFSFQYAWNATGSRSLQYTSGPGAHDRTVSAHSTRSRASLSVDARTPTAYGTVRTFTTFRFDDQDEGDFSARPQRAYIQWAGFTIGRTRSITDPEGDFADSETHSLFRSETLTNSSARYAWQLGRGMTLTIGADERRVGPLVNRSVTSVTVGVEPASARAGNRHPDPWAALRVDQAWGKASLAIVGNESRATYYSGSAATCGGQTNSTLCGHPDSKWGWAVISGIDVKLPMIAPGDRIGGYFSYGVGAIRYSGGRTLRGPGLFGSGNEVALGITSDGVYITGSQVELTTAWTAGAAYQHFWTRNFSTSVYGDYTKVSYNSTVVNGGWWCTGGGGGAAAASDLDPVGNQACNPSFKYWSVGTHTDWYPVPNLRLAVDVIHVGIGTAMAGSVSLAKAQGARPTGLYTAKNLGLTAVAVRAQRSWP